MRNKIMSMLFDETKRFCQTTSIMHEDLYIWHWHYHLLTYYLTLLLNSKEYM